jgi:hypothetical protein
MNETYLFGAAFVLILGATVHAARVRIRKQRLMDAFNQSLWDANRMGRFKRWIRSVDYVGPEKLRPRWSWRPDPHDHF